MPGNGVQYGYGVRRQDWACVRHGVKTYLFLLVWTTVIQKVSANCHTLEVRKMQLLLGI